MNFHSSYGISINAFKKYTLGHCPKVLWHPPSLGPLGHYQIGSHWLDQGPPPPTLSLLVAVHWFFHSMCVSRCWYCWIKWFCFQKRLQIKKKWWSGFISVSWMVENRKKEKKKSNQNKFFKPFHLKNYSVGSLS